MKSSTCRMPFQLEKYTTQTQSTLLRTMVKISQKPLCRQSCQTHRFSAKAMPGAQFKGLPADKDCHRVNSLCEIQKRDRAARSHNDIIKYNGKIQTKHRVLLLVILLMIGGAFRQHWNNGAPAAAHTIAERTQKPYTYLLFQALHGAAKSKCFWLSRRDVHFSQFGIILVTTRTWMYTSLT